MSWISFIVTVIILAVLITITSEFEAAAFLAMEKLDPEKFDEVRKRIEDGWMYKFMIKHFKKE